MKIALLNDTHAGIKNGSDIFLDYAESFYTNTFFPYLKEHGIKKILHLGDYFDHRRFVNFKVLKRNYEHFISKLNEYDLTMDIIPGNHDVYYKNTNDLNSLNEILEQHDRITIYNEAKVVSYDKLDVLLLPWICEENHDRSIEAIKKSKASILAGHLELGGFEVMRGIKAIDGMDRKLFVRFDMVLSGHYHEKSSKDNIHYLGTQFQFTFADANEDKYFHILDTDKRELTSVRNPDSMFHKLIYDEDKVPEIKKEYKDSYVKIIVLNKKDLYSYDKWLDKIHKAEPFEIKILESFDEYLGENVEDEGITTTDTSTLLNSYIDSTETDLNKNILKKLMQELFLEAQNIDEI